MPAVSPQGIFYLASSVRPADITDGTSNTAFFSEKIRGQGQPNPKTDMLIFTNQTSQDASYQACKALPLTSPPLTSQQGMSWVMGEMCCTAYNHVSTPNGQTCAGLQIHVLDREAFEPVRTGLAVLAALRDDAGPNFAWRSGPYEFVTDRLAIDLLFGSDRERRALEAGPRPRGAQ